ncbi:uncharacterized protein KGF55_002026 [Candida pseudojiufengensis]|uniref:uncharacterized protein n=1 Tax=Candida pseudojiufengensis TaxID=497109 RepID=UPI0022249E46|nr:uncharacterized protein KGF55_002026 [Candida pseudojiufengensis]KAI5964084.1 hypothetical protein KGF55_002026 [Candida pseudojiufengensis]
MNIHDLVQERDSTPLVEEKPEESKSIENSEFKVEDQTQEIGDIQDEKSNIEDTKESTTTESKGIHQEQLPEKEDEPMEEPTEAPAKEPTDEIMEEATDEHNTEPSPQPIVKTEQIETPRQTPQPQIHQPNTTNNKKIKQETSTIETSNLPPLHEIVGGSSIRRYLNKHLTQHLLEGLKEVGNVKPDDPLRYLGEFLIARSEDEKLKEE